MKLSYGTNRTSVPFPLTSMFNNHILFEFAQPYLKRQLWFDPGNGIDAIVEDESELWFCCKLMESHLNASMDSEEWDSVQASREDEKHTEEYESRFTEEMHSSEDDVVYGSDEDELVS
jgi:hypothetical protein